MAHFFQNVRTFATNPGIRRLYLSWIAQRTFGRRPSIEVAGGRLYAAGGFNSFYSLAVQGSCVDDFAVFRQFLRPGGIYFDVGANIGVTTLLAARAASPLQIVAFEPTAESAEVWRRNIQINQIQNATLFECALSEKTGVMEFISERGASVDNRLNIGGTRSRHERAGRGQSVVRRVQTTSLDEVCAKLDVPRISLLKIDVEGAEPIVLRGSQTMLKRKAIEAIFLEFVPGYMRDMGENIEAFIETMSALGYFPFEICSDGTVGKLIPKTNLIAGEFRGPNIILKAKA